VKWFNNAKGYGFLGKAEQTSSFVTAPFWSMATRVWTKRWGRVRHHWEEQGTADGSRCPPARGRRSFI